MLRWLLRDDAYAPPRGYLAASQRWQPLNTDRWYFRVFQSAPDPIRALLPGSTATANALCYYRFEALEIKELSHRLAAQSCRFLQKNPQVEHLEVLVITPHQRINLGPTKLPRLLKVLLQKVHWVSLEELSQQPADPGKPP